MNSSATPQVGWWLLSPVDAAAAVVWSAILLVQRSLAAKVVVDSAIQQVG